MPNLCAILVALGAVLPAAEPVLGPLASKPLATALTSAPLLQVRHAGTAPVILDTTALAGPALRAWWVDGVSGVTVDAGSVPRADGVVLHPPDTGDATVRDWTLVIVDATRGLVPPAQPSASAPLRVATPFTIDDGRISRVLRHTELSDALHALDLTAADEVTRRSQG